MPVTEDELRDQRLLLEIGQITHEYGALHRRTVRELARTRAELAQAHQVLGAVAHDLRTPLTAVRGFTELLLCGDLAPTQRDLAERAVHAARTMGDLTDELVEAVALGGSPLVVTTLDLVEVVTNVVSRHQLLGPDRGVRVIVDRRQADNAPVLTQGDERQLERVLDNLVSNAVKFSPDGGCVRVSVTADHRNAELRVRDEGPGLAEGQLEAVFSPFHRAPEAESIPGAGLGLTIVRQIATKHGGRVHAESVHGAGATFVVRLPLATPTQNRAFPEGSAARTGDSLT